MKIEFRTSSNYSKTYCNKTVESMADFKKEAINFLTECGYYKVPIPKKRVGVSESEPNRPEEVKKWMPLRDFKETIKEGGTYHLGVFSEI